MSQPYTIANRGGRGTGTAVPAKSVSPGSQSPHFRSRGLSPESQSPGSLSPQFLSPSQSPVPTFEFFSPRPRPRSPIFKFVSPSLSPVPDFRNFCPRPCPRSQNDLKYPNDLKNPNALNDLKFFRDHGTQSFILVDNLSKFENFRILTPNNNHKL